MTVVNVVGSGALPVELDVDRLVVDIGEPIAEYDPGTYPGTYLRFEENAPLITVHRTGKYIITGAVSAEESRDIRGRFLNFLSGIGALEEPGDEWFSIQNYVCTGEIGSAQNLSALAIGLGLENTEYEPEQFPGLIYRPESRDCVILIFATGKVVLTGATDLQDAEAAFDRLQGELAEIIS